MASEVDVRRLLGATTLPEATVDELLGEVSLLWLLSDATELLAGDLALCHPALGDDEVRAAVRPLTTPYTWRLTVVAHDRPGLLAALAGTLAEHGLNITRASATTWGDGAGALLSVAVSDPGKLRLDNRDWDLLTRRLKRAIAGNHVPTVAYTPRSPVAVRTAPQAGGRVLVEVEAPDGVGLLSVITAWFAEESVNIEAMRVDSSDGRVDDSFLVDGTVDAAGLVTRLTGRPPAPRASLPDVRTVVSAVVGAVTWPVRAAIDGIGRLARR